MTKLVIEKNIPLPTARNRPNVLSDLLLKMEVGDSVLTAATYQSAANPVMKRVEAKTGNKYTTRKTPDGIRIWRIA